MVRKYATKSNRFEIAHRVRRNIEQITERKIEHSELQLSCSVARRHDANSLPRRA